MAYQFEFERGSIQYVAGTVQSIVLRFKQVLILSFLCYILDEVGCQLNVH